LIKKYLEDFSRLKDPEYDSIMGQITKEAFSHHKIKDQVRTLYEIIGPLLSINYTAFDEILHEIYEKKYKKQASEEEYLDLLMSIDDEHRRIIFNKQPASEE